MGLFSGIGKMLGGFSARAAAKRAMRRANADKKKRTAELKSLENSRQAIINPYQNTKDLSSLAVDLSGKLSNPFASLGVSTAAAEMQAEQTDIALANTLDTLRATGAGAGGATALAQAALQGKKGIAASIENQEMQNERLKAQGQQALEQAQMREGVRVQNVQIQEGRRTQQADALGKTFQFNARERRESEKINYTRGLRDQAKSRELGAAQAKASAMGQIWGGLGGTLDSAVSSGLIKTSSKLKAAAGGGSSSSSGGGDTYNYYYGSDSSE